MPLHPHWDMNCQQDVLQATEVENGILEMGEMLAHSKRAHLYCLEFEELLSYLHFQRRCLLNNEELLYSEYSLVPGKSAGTISAPAPAIKEMHCLTITVQLVQLYPLPYPHGHVAWITHSVRLDSNPNFLTYIVHSPYLRNVNRWRNTGQHGCTKHDLLDISTL